MSVELRALVTEAEEDWTNNVVLGDLRKATVDDVVAWLTEHGAEIKDQITHELWDGSVRRVVDLDRSRGLGDRYLVYKLPE